MKKVLLAFVLLFFPIMLIHAESIPSQADAMNERLQNYMTELNQKCKQSKEECDSSRSEYSSLGSEARDLLDEAKREGLEDDASIQALQKNYDVYVESAEGGFGTSWSFNLKSGCDSIYGGGIGEYINHLFTFVKYAGLALVVILSTLDFLKVIAADKDDSLSKAFNRLVKRCIALILLFLTPSLIKFAFGLLSIAGSNGDVIDVCVDIIK